ncbi:MAG: metallophosphoesterase [Planctomycetota bacterium]
MDSQILESPEVEAPAANGISLDPDIPLPVVVLSDLHLGHPASFLRNPEMVLPLLGDARTLIVNGDSCEQIALPYRDDAREKLARLVDLCADRGVGTMFLTGNHDPLVSNLDYLDLFDGRVFMTHGDMLHPLVAPWSREGPIMGVERRRILRHEPEPRDLNDVLHLTKRSTLVASVYPPAIRGGFFSRVELLSRFALKPWRIIRTLDYWGNVSHYCHGIRERHRPEARLMLIGHTHRAGIWQTHDFTIVNTGSYHLLSKPMVVHLQEHRAVVHQAVRRGQEYVLGQELYHMPLKSRTESRSR